MTEPGIIAASFHLASRLAYVFGVGLIRAGRKANQVYKQNRDQFALIVSGL